MPEWAPYIMVLSASEGLPAMSGLVVVWFLELSEAFGFPALLEGE